MKFISNFYIVLFFGLFIFGSCNPDPPVDPPNDEEVITTLTYTLVSAGGGDVVVLSFVDLDGDGGSAPTITGGTLSTGTEYTGSLSLLNQAEEPAENITEEVAEEDDEHQFFFAADGVDLTVAYTDMDGDGNPLGLTTSVVAGGATGSGTLTVTLRHEPKKPNDGSLTDAGGETDIEVAFPITIQ